MPDRFSDISTHWAKACILKLAELKIINGFPNGEFRPDAVLTRAEFATLMDAAFPNLPLVREAVYFPDVPQTHWAHNAVKWGYERGLFSGYPEGYFQPSTPIPRMQVLVVLATALRLPKPDRINETLTLYFDDAAEIPDWTRWSIAAATLDNRIVNYPDVRRFRPTLNATRGEVAALLSAALNLVEAIPRQYATWNLGIYDIKDSLTVPFERWKGCARLLRDIQVILTDFRLYPGTPIDGRYSWQTQQALEQFCAFYGLNAMAVGAFDAKFAWSLINASSVDFILANSKDRQKIFNDYLAQEAGFDAAGLAFLDRGYETSAYAGDIPKFPDRLTQKPDGTRVVSLGASAVQAGTNAVVTFNLYPARGEKPPIDGIGLDFLHPDILQACVCVGSFVDGMIRARWFGRDALKPAQLWSTTKFLPLLNVVCRANAADANALVKDCLICPTDTKNGYGFYDLAAGLVNYHSPLGSSNAIAATFKQFSTPGELEAWVQRITGNYSTQFQGRYGEPPTIELPDLWSQPFGKALLKPPRPSHSGNNLLSTYDLTRFISLLGWHNHLAPGAQLPARWSNLETVVRAMALDTARYVDVAIDKLGLASAIAAPVILSKLGFGRSEARDRTELAYVAFVQFLDQRVKNKPAILRTVSLALLGASAKGDANEEARQLDARMAAEVTELLRQVVAQELV